MNVTYMALPGLLGIHATQKFRRNGLPPHLPPPHFPSHPLGLHEQDVNDMLLMPILLRCTPSQLSWTCMHKFPSVVFPYLSMIKLEVQCIEGMC